MSTMLSVLVPVYNEEATLAHLMSELTKACPDAQIVYVDDGSADQSLSILRKHARQTDIVVAAPHGGKGSAIRAGLERVTGEYTVIQDADLEYDPKQITELVECAKKHPGCAVFGSRFLTKNPTSHWRFLMGNKVLTACMNVLYFTRITDSYTCYKLLPTPAFQGLGLTSNGFELEAEICAKCIRKGMRIVEVPIHYKPRTIEQGKKIRWQDAVKGLWMMVRVRCGIVFER